MKVGQRLFFPNFGRVMVGGTASDANENHHGGRLVQQLQQ